MKRNEAVTCLRAINLNCRYMSPDAVVLVNSKPTDQFSTGYQVHIQTSLDRETKQQIQLIIKKHNLALREENGKIVIYQPKLTALATP